MPSNTEDWPEGTAFYHYDTVYDAHNVGYAGPQFSYATMPDQYTLAAFQRLELAQPDRAPVMAEIDLVSSHTPWAPLPRMVAWGEVGDGSVFDGDAGSRAGSRRRSWRDPDQVQRGLRPVDRVHARRAGLVRADLHDDEPGARGARRPPAGDDRVRDRTPATTCRSSIVAHDPAVLDRVAGWGWQDGLRPGPGAPVWPMDAFRDRFLAAYSTPRG